MSDKKKMFFSIIALSTAFATIVTGTVAFITAFKPVVRIMYTTIEKSNKNE